MTSNHTIVETLVACRSALKDLEIEEFVAVDAEGINLSMTGPLTLLQIGTSGGHVYLFDVATEPRMFHDGGLKQFLENASIVKVMHSSRNDGEALYWQFDVVLQGVFDTQLAQMELDRLEGHLLPSRKKLAEVCAKYSPEKTEILNEDKDALQSKWNKKDGDYWNRRPLTQEMIQYACKDVVVLVPEVYTVQKRLLERQGLLKKFQEHVQQDIESRRNKELQDTLHREQDAAVLHVLRDFARNVTPATKLEDVTDETPLITHLPHLADIRVLMFWLRSTSLESATTYYNYCRNLSSISEYNFFDPSWRSCRQNSKTRVTILNREVTHTVF